MMSSELSSEEPWGEAVETPSSSNPTSIAMVPGSSIGNEVRTARIHTDKKKKEWSGVE